MLTWKKSLLGALVGSWRALKEVLVVWAQHLLIPSTGVLCCEAFGTLPGLLAGWAVHGAGITPPLSCRILRNCHDDASRFTSLLAKPGCDCLRQEDFIPLLQVLPRLCRDAGHRATFTRHLLHFHGIKCLPRTSRPWVWTAPGWGSFWREIEISFLSA